ncbi:uncharacterized protein MYCFIDRAFT_88431 [Pseudocercospora fijiensis CIRAD86]|uniref:Uncharacterized protein n=1 Tax=Pseudocercospora fijiensis (strain CIRAD86) TaxID=383855 RepID=M2Z7U0_PSEFD|nr:uncharacterized protein MYCFIDRAFT_88431 [Pseudocercospora fijiensis CIRAD86]EME85825.1 hypothetical protein MYCFIDRAFT_88431 [Pseudocercospora fijiensis CIRAD86]
MAVREKVKGLFKSKSQSDRDSQLSKTSTQASDRERWPSNVYKPGEPMPRPKYRAPPKKEHKERLEAFSFTEAWRRKSFQSQYSPMGTRAPSRNNSTRQPSRRSSWISLGRKSSDGRTNSFTSADTEKSNVRQREHMGVAQPPKLWTEAENSEGDDDVNNVGMSRVASKDRNHPVVSRPRTADGPTDLVLPHMNAISKTITARDHQPFTEEQLALAINRSHSVVPAHA